MGALLPNRVRPVSDLSQAQPASEPERVAEGWFGPSGSRKFHYFGDDLRALCGKWMLWAHPQDVGMDWNMAQGFNCEGDCATCSKKLVAR